MILFNYNCIQSSNNIQITGFAPPVPRWFSQPLPPSPIRVPASSAASAPEAAPSPVESHPEDAVRVDDFTLPIAKRPRPPPEPDPTPANIKPYWARAELPQLDEPVARTRPKVKSRKAPVASHPPALP